MDFLAKVEALFDHSKVLELKEFISLNKERYEKEVPEVLKEKIEDDIKYHDEVTKSIVAECPTIYDDKNVHCSVNDNLHSKEREYMGFINGQRDLKVSKI